MTKTINNWKPVVKSFIKIALSHGLKLHSVDNGEERIETTDIKTAVDEICSVDEGHVYFLTEEGKKIWAWLVLGNEPFETVADSIVHPALDKACDEFSEKWENRKVPTKEV